MNCNKCGKDMAVGEFVEKAGLCTECYLENGRETGDVTRDERALTIPDIYLAEFIGMLHRACDNGRPTEALWGMLDSWCDEQERYLEEKYPTERKQGPCPISLHFVTKPCEPVNFPGLSEFITTGYYAPVDTPEHTTASIVEETLRAAIGKQSSNLFALGSAGRLGSIAMHQHDLERIREMYSRQAGEPKEPETDAPLDESWQATFEEIRRTREEIARRAAESFLKEHPDRVAPEMERNNATPFERRFPVEPLKAMINPTLEELQAPLCLCRRFQGDNLVCPQHGKGSAWYDLHGGE